MSSRPNQKILPGFIISCGSIARLIAVMTAIASDTMLARQIFDLALANAMLSGAGAVHRQSALGAVSFQVECTPTRHARVAIWLRTSFTLAERCCRRVPVLSRCGTGT
jgi:hypothetical protein